MNLNPLLSKRYLAVPLIIASLFSGCKENEGELGAAAKAAFKVTPVAGKANTYLLESTSDNAFRYQWDIGAGQGIRAGKAVDTAYYLKKGTYDIKLYAYGNGGYDVSSQQVTVTSDDLSPILNNPVFQKLTAHPWKLNPASSAPVIVGTEGNPAEYFPGGPLADCQKDDIYTFAFVNNDFKASYNANGSTFNAGNIAPNYSCAADRSYNNVSFTFSSTVSGVGLATITLPGNPPANFIGVTDVSSNNYRIISISDTEMVLRSGKTNETVHQMRFVAQ
ncbi:hypothetical protein [Desertivirga arenae]|uniref:hypothetical protein n=1 Tax=Desertivirga arenae TaxID=2810309 RepID=UPI001A977AF3|nr:hypothetical protein [Pedobacter sp. SYSU D00823]